MVIVHDGRALINGHCVILKRASLAFLTMWGHWERTAIHQSGSWVHWKSNIKAPCLEHKERESCTLIKLSYLFQRLNKTIFVEGFSKSLLQKPLRKIFTEFWGFWTDTNGTSVLWSSRNDLCPGGFRCWGNWHQYLWDSCYSHGLAF